MKAPLLHLLALPVLMAMATSSCDCTVHEYPDGTEASVSLTMIVDNEAPQIYTIVDYTSGTKQTFNIAEWIGHATINGMPTFSRAYDIYDRGIDASKWDTRLVWEIHDGSIEDVKKGATRVVQRGSQLVAVENNPRYTTTVDIPAGKYTLLAWADYVPTGHDSDYYYDTSDFWKIKSDFDRRKECDENCQRDCYAKVYEFTVADVETAGEARAYTTTLTRPQGRYVVLSSDYDKYLDLTNRPVDENTSLIAYPSFINVGYSIPELRPNESAKGLYYKFIPGLYTFDERQMVCLGDDYSFVNGEESHVTLNIKVTNPTLGQLSTNSGIDIPLYANRLTVVIGKFLTDSSSSGGLDINDNFDDEIIIEY